MTFDLKTLIEYFIGAFACCFGIYMVGCIILRKYDSIKSLKNILLIVLLTFVIIINSLTFDNILKTFGILLCIFLIYCFIHKVNVAKTLILTTITEILILCGDATFALLTSIFTTLFRISLNVIFFKIYLVTISVFIIVISYTFLLRKFINKFINYINKNNMIHLFSFGIVLVFVLMAVLYKILFGNLVFNYELILYLIIVFGCIALAITLAIQYIKHKEINDKHEVLKKYLKTSADLVERHSATIHKHKNNLIAVKGYLKADVKKAEEYIDTLIENYENNKFGWIVKTNYIQHDTLRYLIYHKLSNSEQENLKIVVMVSKDVKIIDNDYFTVHEISPIFDIIGEYFDNAIYASCESDEKEINFDLFIENNELVFIIGNTFKNEVDLNKITKKGYTTKGRGHGLGLKDIDRIVKSKSYLRNEYQILDNYFVVKLMVKLKNKKNLSKVK